jgi:hypothetical protein
MNRIMVFFILLVVTQSANSSIIQYDFSWSGDAGYSAVGFFTYNSSDISITVDNLIEESELTDFSFSAFTPSNTLMKTYTLSNQNRFNFNFDLLTEEINGSSASFSSTNNLSVGVLLGGSSLTGVIPTSDPNDYQFFNSAGCLSPGFMLAQINGSCRDINNEQKFLDNGGTLLVALNQTGNSNTKIPEPSTFILIIAGGLLLLIRQVNQKSLDFGN